MHFDDKNNPIFQAYTSEEELREEEREFKNLAMSFPSVWFCLRMGRRSWSGQDPSGI